MEKFKIYNPEKIGAAEFDWDSIPSNEKATSEDIENIDAKNAGIFDGFNHNLNKEVNDAIHSENPLESLRKIRKDLNIPGGVYGVNVADFIRESRKTLFMRVEENLLSAVCESVSVLGKELTDALYAHAVEETLKRQIETL